MYKYTNESDILYRHRIRERERQRRGEVAKERTRSERKALVRVISPCPHIHKSCIFIFLVIDLRLNLKIVSNLPVFFG